MRTVILDLGGVVFFSESGNNEYRLRRLLANYNLPNDRARDIALKGHTFYLNTIKNKKSILNIHEEMKLYNEYYLYVNFLLKSIGIKARISDLYYLHPVLNYKLFPESKKALIYLSGKYELAALSNGLPSSYMFLHANDLHYFFKHIITSKQIGLQKPDIKIYRHILGIMDRQSQRCLYIDDKKINLFPAISLGIKSFQFKHKHANLYNFVKKIGL